MKTLGMLAGANGKHRMHDTAQFDRHVLSNGIVVWLQKPVIQTDYRGYLSVFFAGVGENIDPINRKGLAHFFEHMMFRGSVNRPTKDLLIDPITGNSGFINANTSRWYTEYQVQIHSDLLKIAAEILADMLMNPLFESKIIPIEKQVVLGEIREHRITGEQLKGVHGKKVVYPKNHPFLVQDRGYPSHLERITENDLHDFFQENYHAGRANIICGGNFSFRDDVLDILENFFGKMRSGTAWSGVVAPYRANKSGDYSFVDRRFVTDSFDLCYFFDALEDRQYRALDFLISSIGCSFGSPLFHELREKHGWVYSFSLSCHKTSEGPFALFTSTLDPKRFSDAQQIFFEVLRNISEDFIIRRMREAQMRREIGFQDSIDVCKGTAIEIMIDGNACSYSESENATDDLLLEDVLSWRDKLLSLKPLVIKFLTK